MTRRLRDRPAPRAGGDRHFEPHGTLNDLAGEEFAGWIASRRARAAVEKLRELGLLVKEEPHENNVGYSERAAYRSSRGLSEQWFPEVPDDRAGARRRAQPAHTGSSPTAGKRSTTTGWKTSRTGASRASSGGAIASRSGTRTARCAARWTPRRRLVQDGDVLDTVVLLLAVGARHTMDDATRAKFTPRACS